MLGFQTEGSIAFNVINLANTLHASGYSAYLLLDALWFIRWSLRATEIILNVRVSNCKRDHRCMLPVLTQIGVVSRVRFAS